MVAKSNIQCLSYANDERLSGKVNLNNYNPTNRTLADVTTKELNEMTYEEFEMIVHQPVHYPEMKAESVEMKLAYDESLNDTKREVMIDKLISNGTEPNLIFKL